jgi:hypothetical protein
MYDGHRKLCWAQLGHEYVHRQSTVYQKQLDDWMIDLSHVQDSKVPKNSPKDSDERQIYLTFLRFAGRLVPDLEHPGTVWNNGGPCFKFAKHLCV